MPIYSFHLLKTEMKVEKAVILFGGHMRICLFANEVELMRTCGRNWKWIHKELVSFSNDFLYQYDNIFACW